MLVRFGDFDRTFGAIDEFRRRMDRLMDEFNLGYGNAATTGRWPHTTIFDNGESYIIRADVPGMQKDELKLTIENRVLMLSGERKTSVPEGYTVHRQERGQMRFSRSFSLPSEINGEKVGATVKDGVLMITLPKTEAAMPRQISVSQQ